MVELTERQKELADHIAGIGAVEYKPTKLRYHDKHPEAPLSPIYIDLRMFKRFPSSMKVAIDNYEELLKNINFDLLSDVPTAGAYFITPIQERVKKGVVTPKLKDKNYGSGKRIEGMLDTDKGETTVLIDDLITDAGSKLDAALMLRESGLMVKDVAVLVDRQHGGRDHLAANGLELHNSLNLDEILEYYLQKDRLPVEQYREVMSGLEELREFQRLNP